MIARVWQWRHRRRLAIVAIAFLLGVILALGMREILIEEIPIFGFHDIVDLENPDDLPPRRLEASSDYDIQRFSVFLETLVQQDYWFLTSQDLYDYFLSPQPLPIPSDRRQQKKVAIALDDGYQSAHRNLLPLLETMEEKYGTVVKLIWFVNPAFMGLSGTTLPHASCEELRAGVAKGYYDLQSHTSNHRDLTQLSPRERDSELSGSQTILRACIRDLVPEQTVAAHLAYPFGAIDDSAIADVKKYYLSGYVYDGRLMKLNGTLDRYRIPRLTVNRQRSVRQLLRLAAGGWL